MDKSVKNTDRSPLVSSQPTPPLSNLPLLVFAHHPEAQAFLERDRLTLIKHQSISPTSELFKPYQHYQGKNYHLLITHGGAERSMFAITKLLAQYRYQTVINLGFAGALSPALKLGEVSVINIAYGMREQKPVKPFFESFSLFNNKNQLHPLQATIRSQAKKLRYPLRDVLSVTNPLLLPRSKAKFLPFAPLVDQELWWIGFICSREHIPLASIKLVSDLAAQTTKRTEIKKHQNTFALRLYDAFYALTGFAKEKKAIPTLAPLESFEQELIRTLMKNKNFYFTVSQKKIFFELVKKIAEKATAKPSSTFGTMSEAVISKVISATTISILTKRTNLTPKTRTVQLLNTLSELCYPQANGYHRYVKELVARANQKGFRLEVDFRLEDSEIGISFRVRNLTEWEKYLKDLPNKEVTELLRILAGEVAPDDIKQKTKGLEKKIQPRNSVRTKKELKTSAKSSAHKPIAVKH